jgi:predicted DNA-binding transcriptional regulator AlpA
MLGVRVKSKRETFRLAHDLEGRALSSARCFDAAVETQAPESKLFGRSEIRYRREAVDAWLEQRADKRASE